MIVSLDGGHVSGPWRVDWYGSYGFRLDDYDALASLTHTVGSSGRVRAGLEIAADGDSNYSAYHIGPVLGVKVGDQADPRFQPASATETIVGPMAMSASVSIAASDPGSSQPNRQAGRRS